MNIKTMTDKIQAVMVDSTWASSYVSSLRKSLEDFDFETVPKSRANKCFVVKVNDIGLVITDINNQVMIKEADLLLTFYYDLTPQGFEADLENAQNNMETIINYWQKQTNFKQSGMPTGLLNFVFTGERHRIEDKKTGAVFEITFKVQYYDALT